DRLILSNFGNVIAGLINIGIAEYEERAHRRIGNQLERRFQKKRARSLRSNQRASDIETFFRQKIVKIVAGNAARNFRETFSNVIAVPFSQIDKLLVNLGTPSAIADD